MTNEDRNDEKPELTPVTEEYTQVNANFRMLADIRFKLLALIPTLGGVAIFLLSRMQQGASERRPDDSLLFLISCLGFVATLGVTFYDQRNSELYNALISRARHLEKRLNLPRNPRVKRKCSSSYGGQFEERPGRGRHLFRFIELGHDSGLALIYGAVLGAWFYPLSSTFFGWTGLFAESRHRFSLLIAAFMVVLFIAELLRLDGTTSIRELLGPSSKVKVRMKHGHDIQEERLHFRGKEIGCYKGGDLSLTLYKCPGGRFRVYAEYSDYDIAFLKPWRRNSDGGLEYPTYQGEAQLLEEYPEFREAVRRSPIRYLY